MCVRADPVGHVGEWSANAVRYEPIRGSRPLQGVAETAGVVVGAHIPDPANGGVILWHRGRYEVHRPEAVNAVRDAILE
ncbi:hypothetical protein EAH80_14190 [Mycobacterium hodleri]|uniref:Uncharacterized protein n=1 Tax=Mycolicibacterium hodleri TaxID=49897 RepID=A0A502E6V6_9MYCO|nr:hypothetical protein EAH80_14190 [Mycolicibacterium hodleri]